MKEWQAVYPALHALGNSFMEEGEQANNERGVPLSWPGNAGHGHNREGQPWKRMHNFPIVDPQSSLVL